MSHLDNKVPPIRESRHPETTLAHGGTISCRKKVLPACQGASQNDRSFTQGSICPLLPALGIMCSLPETVVLLHGAVGCGSCCHGSNVNARTGNAARGRNSGDAIWLSTALDENDVIQGGDEKLAKAIKEADAAYSPKVILTVSGCLPGIIGDDIDDVALRVQPKVGARILPVHCEGFKSRFMANAYDVVYHALGRHLLPEPGKQGPVDPKTVNVMNVGSMGLADEKELGRLVEELGFKANFFPVFAHPDSFSQATRAVLSISVCPTHDDYILTHLKEKYGVPYIIRHMPIGIANTSQWFLDLGRQLGVVDKAKLIIKREEKALQKALADFRPLFESKKVFVSAGEYRSLATASLLRELGFELSGIRSFHYDKFADVELEKLSKNGPDFVFNVANVQPFEEANVLTRLKPDLFLGHMHGNNTAARLGIPTQVIYNSGYVYLGYKGAYDLARRLYRRLTNTAFYDRLGRFGRLPYKKSWYKAQPFSHIRSNAGGL